MNRITGRLHPLLFIVLGLSLVLSPGPGQAQERMQRQSIEVAQKALSSYIADIVNETNFSQFGFKSLQEAKSASLGEGYQVMMIGLKDLKAYKAGADPKSLLRDTKTLWFPVMVKGEVRTKLEMIERNGQWTAGEFGGIQRVREVENAKRQLPKLLESREISSPLKTALVKVPVLQATFLYVESSKGNFFIPAMVNPERFKLQNGQIYAAEEVISQLREIAKDMDENKVM